MYSCHHCQSGVWAGKVSSWNRLAMFLPRHRVDCHRRIGEALLGVNAGGWVGCNWFWLVFIQVFEPHLPSTAMQGASIGFVRDS